MARRIFSLISLYLAVYMTYVVIKPFAESAKGWYPLLFSSFIVLQVFCVGLSSHRNFGLPHWTVLVLEVAALNTVSLFYGKTFIGLAFYCYPFILVQFLILGIISLETWYSQRKNKREN